MPIAELEDTRLAQTGAFRVGAVDRQKNQLRDVSILTGEMEAIGHDEWLDKKSIESAAKLLIGRSIPAYITHENAQGDRLTDEVGQWSGFYVDGDQIRARQFKFFPSFERDEKPRMSRLLDLAQEMPEEFGVSIVHSKRLVWVMPDGTEIPAARGEDPPPGAVRTIPSVRFSAIESADFTKEPATNPAGLYSEPVDEPAKDMSKDLQTELDTLRGEFSTYKTTAEKAATDAENLKAAYARDRAAFEKQVNDLTAERDTAKTTLETERAAFAKKEAETKAATDGAYAVLKGKLEQAERMSAYRLGVPPPDFVLDEKTVVTAENAWSAYNSIKDARERTAFYRKHRDLLTRTRKSA